MGKAPIFLERKSYRARRIKDAVKVLPFVGLVTLMVPLIWPRPGTSEAGTGIAMSDALQYLFGVWIMLVLLAWLLWRRTSADERHLAARTEHAEAAAPPDEGEGG